MGVHLTASTTNASIIRGYERWMEHAEYENLPGNRGFRMQTISVRTLGQKPPTAKTISGQTKICVALTNTAASIIRPRRVAMNSTQRHLWA